MSILSSWLRTATRAGNISPLAARLNGSCAPRRVRCWLFVRKSTIFFNMKRDCCASCRGKKDGRCKGRAETDRFTNSAQKKAMHPYLNFPSDSDENQAPQVADPLSETESG